MGKEVYITDEERKKCRNVADAFRELYELTDVVVHQYWVLRLRNLSMRIYSNACQKKSKRNLWQNVFILRKGAKESQVKSAGERNDLL